MTWDAQTEQFVIKEVLREGCVVEMIKIVKEKIQEEQSCDSRQPLLLATPNVWKEKYPKLKLDFLEGDVIRDLVNNNYAYKPNYIDELDFDKLLVDEISYFEHEGRLDSIQGAEALIRNDKVTWVNLHDIKAEKSRKLYHLIQIFNALPFELNLKANLYTQISEVIQLSAFPKGEEALHKLHMDSAFEKKLDTGRKFSVLYFCFKNDDGKSLPVMRLKRKVLEKEKGEWEEEVKELSVGSNSLVILKSRLIGYEIQAPENVKLFVVRYWIHGPGDLTNFTM